MLAADVVTVRLGDCSDGDLAHLGAAAHNDDPLPVDLLQRLHQFHGPHDGQLAQILEQRLGAAGERNFEIGTSLFWAIVQDLDRGYVTVMARNHAGQLVQDAGLAGGVDDQADGLVGHVS